MPEPHEGNQRLAQAGEDDRADKGARHGAGEREVVVGGAQAAADVDDGRAVDEDVVRGLQVEGLLDLGVGGDDEVDEGDEDEEGVYEQIYRGKREQERR